MGRAHGAPFARADAEMSTDSRQVLGAMGEALACAELERRGYVILERRFRTRVGEIDLVARDGETTVFVEVKARQACAFGGGAAAVGTWKQRRLVRVAEAYLVRHRLVERPCRFDVVTIDWQAGEARMEVYTHAFGA